MALNGEEALEGKPNPNRGRYDFAVVPGSSHARAMTFLDAHAAPGLVLDLGCSFGRIAETVAERGRSYLGVDLDDDALASLRGRGHETGRLDLTVPGHVARLGDLIGERPVGAVFALDVIEHLPDTAAFLDQIVALLGRWGDPLLVTSIPNVAHRDLAAKLLAGRWDYSEVGLLDSTHVSLFTERRMLNEFTARGLACVEADDVIQPAWDQHFPPLHPYLVEGGPTAYLISWLRSLADSRGDTYQFVRAWRRSPTAPPSATIRPSPTASTSKLTVVVADRDDHDVMGGLEDTLVCLAAQDTDDFDVVLPVPPDRVPAADALVRSFAADVADRISVRPVDAAAAGRLNAVLGQVTAPLMSFVVAGDVVTATWARHLVEGAARHPGAVVRVRSFERIVKRSADVTLSQSNAGPSSEEHFDLLRHLSLDQLPLGSFALPTDLCRAGLRFEEGARSAVWKFTFLAAMLAGVADIAAIDCVHQRVAGYADPTAGDLAAALGRTPVFLPPGSAARLQGDRNHLAYLSGELAAARQQADAATRNYEDVCASRWWRATAPARKAVTLVRANRRAQP